METGQGTRCTSAARNLMNNVSENFSVATEKVLMEQEELNDPATQYLPFFPDILIDH